MAKRTQKRGLAVELAFVKRLAVRMPEDIPVLQTLADLLSEAGCREESLETDLRLARIEPDNPAVWYNLACSYTLMGMPDEAFDSLSKAVALGYDNYHWFMQDEDISALRKDARFYVLLNRMKKNAKTGGC